MPPLKTFEFVNKFNENISIVIKSYSIGEALNVLYETTKNPIEFNLFQK